MPSATMQHVLAKCTPSIIQLTYWLVARAETLRRPEVAAVVEAIRARMHEQRDVLLGAR